MSVEAPMTTEHEEALMVAADAASRYALAHVRFWEALDALGEVTARERDAEVAR